MMYVPALQPVIVKEPLLEVRYCPMIVPPVPEVFPLR